MSERGVWMDGWTDVSMYVCMYGWIERDRDFERSRASECVCERACARERMRARE